MYVCFHDLMRKWFCLEDYAKNDTQGGAPISAAIPTATSLNRDRTA